MGLFSYRGTCCDRQVLCDFLLSCAAAESTYQSRWMGAPTSHIGTPNSELHRLPRVCRQVLLGIPEKTSPSTPDNTEHAEGRKTWNCHSLAAAAAAATAAAAAAATEIGLCSESSLLLLARSLARPWDSAISREDNIVRLGPAVVLLGKGALPPARPNWRGRTAICLPRCLFHPGSPAADPTSSSQSPARCR